MSVYDVTIVGSGIAGLFLALNINSDLDVLIVTKKKIKASNSYLAQGGISVLRDDDDFDDFVLDTLKAGKFTGNKKMIEYMVRKSREAIKDLISFGVNFETDENGLKYTRQGGHNKSRVAYYKDITGKEIMDKLIQEVKKRKNIRVVEEIEVVNLLMHENSCYGVTAKCGDELFNVSSKVTVLATGGVGGTFSNTTNFRHIKGDGINIALNNDIKCTGLDKIQVHPTTLYLGNKGRKFLLSETLRGEGAKLFNHNSERFVDETMPRDIVSDAILKEMEQTNSECVYLSFNHKGVEFVKKRFINIYNKCKNAGYELGSDLIPVVPAVHYFMGGIKISSNGETTANKLFAVGECATLNIHGENRLASNSLLEAVVFSKKVARKINKSDLKNYEFEERTYRYENKTNNKKFLKYIKNENLELQK
ncbi:MAG: L-aspartate oxidase [Sarcina sp.]